MKSFLAACCTTAMVSGFRVIKKRKPKDISVVCKYLLMDVLLEKEEADGDTEAVECTTEDGRTFGIDPAELPDAEQDDILSLVLRETGEQTILNDDKYHVVSYDLVSRSNETTSLAESESGNSYTLLVVDTVFSDERSASRRSIQKELQRTRNLVTKGSYNEFGLGAATFQRATVSKRIADVARECKVSNLRTAIEPNIASIKAQMYRMMFIPRSGSGDCDWLGVAKQGCGQPSRKPSLTRDCWSMYRSEMAWVQSHELGHNFGIRHAGGFNGKGVMIEYGDPQAIMGNKNNPTLTYSAAARAQMGFLTARSGELVRASSRKTRLSDIRNGKRTADAVALTHACGSCVPKQDSKKNNVGGELFISFGYSKVMVHLRRANNQGTEQWAALGAGQSWSGHGLSVHVCSIGSSVGVVGTAGTISNAKFFCR